LAAESGGSVTAVTVQVTTQVAVGHPAQELMRAAKAIQADLIVLGHSGHSAAWSGLLGGVTDRVSHHAPCSVLIVR
jgi:nucleotide-binding universal stress UspA family protein